MENILYNTFFGRLILDRYISKNDRRYAHSVGVADFSRRVASRIKHKHPDLTFIDPEFSSFLGYVHDIGYSVKPELHELHTIELLIKNEGIPEDVTWKTIHGQIPEQYGNKIGDINKFYPRGLSGIILTYADMTVNTRPMYMESRVEDIRDRVLSAPITQERKDEILIGLDKAFPRFQNYEKLIFELAGVWKYSHFGFMKERKPGKGGKSRG